MYLPEADSLTDAERQGCVDTFLWHALGEDVVMERIAGADLLPRESPVAETVSAAELVRIVETAGPPTD